MILKTVLLLLSSIAAVVESYQWYLMNDGLVDRVIHVESLRNRGRWVDAHESKWAKISGCPAKEVYFKSWTSFKVIRCGNDVCLESLRYPNYYWDAHHSHYMSISHSNYPQDKIWFKWSIHCTSWTMEICRFYTPRYNKYLDDHHSGYAAIADYGNEWSRFRILAPTPTYKYITVNQLTNNSPDPATLKVHYTESVTSTTTNTFTVTKTLSAEISAVFQAVTPKISGSITTTMTKTTTKTHSKGEDHTYSLSVPPFAHVAFQQLQGIYGPFRIATKTYLITCKYTRTNRPCSATARQIK